VDLIHQPAVRLAQLVLTREASAVEVVEAHLARIGAVDGRLRAMLVVRADEALQEARAADAAPAGRRGPLHGVPFTVKDNIDTAGIVTLMGVESPGDAPAETDAVVVDRLRAAGAILLGKSAIVSPIPGFGSDERRHGRVANPYDRERTPGGSSGGEAAIIAAGGSPCGLGNDSGGSVRTPAALCGVATLKPTAGLVPMTGDEGAMSDPRTQTGALARSVDDVALLTRLIAGPHPRHPEVAPVPLGDPGAIEVGGLRVAVAVRNGVIEPTAAVVDAVTAAAAAVSDAGAATAEVEHPAGGHDLTLRVWESYGGAMASADLYALLADWDRYRRRVLEWFQPYDALLCPAYDRPAPRFDERDDGVGVSYTTPYSLTGWPCAVVRCATSADGTPVAVQVVAHPWRDDVALAVAAHIERELGGWRPPPL
jgi:amidase